ncbi:MAG: DNA polymerase III subunit delta [Clostridia bacterium]|nr:DNA polymerase III subunit delta [Clostridia bacterium]
MTTTDLKNAIKTADFDRCFLFCGEEDYLKQHYLRELRKAVVTDEGFAVFNHYKFEGEKIDYAKLYDAISSPPMMADFKLIEWHLANFDAMKENDLEAFFEFCREKKEYPYSTVVFFSNEDQLSLGNYPKNPSPLYKSLSNECDVVVFEHSTDAQLISWIYRHVRHEELSADEATLRSILDTVGRDMTVLSLEIQKLCAYAKQNGKSEITDSDVATVCSAGGENDAYGLTNALLSKNKRLAYENLLDLKRKKTEPTVILGSLFRFYGEVATVSGFMGASLSQADISKKLKWHEYKTSLYMKFVSKTSQSALDKMLAVCSETDSMAKSMSTLNPYTLIEIMIAQAL